MLTKFLDGAGLLEDMAGAADSVRGALKSVPDPDDGVIPGVAEGVSEGVGDGLLNLT